MSLLLLSFSLHHWAMSLDESSDDSQYDESYESVDEFETFDVVEHAFDGDGDGDGDGTSVSGYEQAGSTSSMVGLFFDRDERPRSSSTSSCTPLLAMPRWATSASRLDDDNSNQSDGGGQELAASDHAKSQLIDVDQDASQSATTTMMIDVDQDASQSATTTMMIDLDQDSPIDDAPALRQSADTMMVHTRRIASLQRLLSNLDPDERPMPMTDRDHRAHDGDTERYMFVFAPESDCHSSDCEADAIDQHAECPICFDAIDLSNACVIKPCQHTYCKTVCAPPHCNSTDLPSIASIAASAALALIRCSVMCSVYYPMPTNQPHFRSCAPQSVEH
jgi:hypothetical protein